jgi:hypothetical protein
VGRSEPIDIMYMSSAGGSPGEGGWAPERRLADLKAQIDLGVTWQAVNASGSTPADVLAMVRAFGDDVISPLR